MGNSLGEEEELGEIGTTAARLTPLGGKGLVHTMKATVQVSSYPVSGGAGLGVGDVLTRITQGWD